MWIPARHGEPDDGRFDVIPLRGRTDMVAKLVRDWKDLPVTPEPIDWLGLTSTAGSARPSSTSSCSSRTAGRSPPDRRRGVGRGRPLPDRGAAAGAAADRAEGLAAALVSGSDQSRYFAGSSPHSATNRDGSKPISRAIPSQRRASSSLASVPCPSAHITPIVAAALPWPASAAR